MIFSTTQFVIYFIAFLLGVIFLKKHVKPYKWFLLIGSFVFYGFAGVHLLYILVFVILVNYFLGWILSLTLQKKLKSHGSKFVLFTAIIVNLLILTYFKYGNFISNLLLELNESIKLPFNVPIIELYITIGLSYYLFKVISHHIDLYRGIIRFPSLLDFSVYLSFFPQILMGPIQRPILFYKELNSTFKFDYDVAKVIVRILSGILKKLVIASFLFETATITFHNPTEFSRIDLIISVFAYGAMLFTDFSGYCDFSVAISNILGFSSVENFNNPYKAVGFKDFWSRWHITLSRWFKDYVYIPLGGNHGGKIKQFLNIFITMVLSGIWHGVGIPFIIWGIYHGICSMITHLFKSITIKNKVVTMFSKLFAWITTLVAVQFGWIFFASRSFEQAVDFIKTIVKPTHHESVLVDFRVLLLIFMVILGNFFGKYLARIFLIILRKINIFSIILLILVVYVLLQLGPDLVPPFVYFSF